MVLPLPSSCLFPPAQRWAPTAGLLFFPDKRQFHSPPPVRCVHIALPTLRCARTHCQTPAALRVSYRCLLEISVGLTPFYATFALCGKKIGLPTLTLESDFCTRDSIFECVLLNPYILFSVFWLFFVTPFPCSVYLLWFNAASFFFLTCSTCR